MKRTTLTQHLASAVIRLAPLFMIAGFFGTADKVYAAAICEGGSVIRDASGTPVGCAFNTWGSAQISMCNGATVIPPNSSGPGACYMCATQPTATQLLKGNFTGLTLQPAPPYAPGEPTTFRCLKCTQPPTGLTAWWTLDETNGVYSDLTGTVSLPGLAHNGVQSVAGEVGNAAKFDGVSQYIDIPNDPNLDIGPAADFSIDAWVQLNPCSPTHSCPADSGVRVIMEKRTFNAPNHYKGYSFYLYNQYLGLQLADGGSAPGYANYGAPALVVPADGQWHFVAVSITRPSAAGFEVQFTLDGSTALVNSPARLGTLQNSSDVRLGMVTIGGGSVFNGSIDEVEFFTRFVLTNEWQNIYNANCNGKCRPQ